VIVVDTGAVYAFYDRDDAWHLAVKELFETERGALVLPTPVIPELDYLLGKRLGRLARLAFLEDMIAGVYAVQQVPLELFEGIRALEIRYHDLDLGFVDAAIVTMARWLQCSRVATLDRRHFTGMAREFKLTLLPSSQ
jgi:uncharacterized protein